jgi:Prolyl oligopeptidase, N-terminal beta-propeller domain
MQRQKMSRTAYVSFEMTTFVFEFCLLLLLVLGYMRVFRSTYCRRIVRKLVVFVKDYFYKKLTYPRSKQFESLKAAELENDVQSTVLNPYLKLEIDSESRDRWLAQQRICFTTYMESLNFTRSQLKSRLRKFQKYEAFESPFRVNETRYFYSKKYRRDQKHFILFTTGNVRHKGSVLFDPNIEFYQQPTIAVLGTWISDDTDQLCYAYTDDRTVTIKVRDVITGKDSEKDTIFYSLENDADAYSFSLAWMKNPKGFFFTRNRSVYYHLLGTSETLDILVYNCRAEKDDNSGLEVYPSTPAVTVASDGSYLVIEIFEECDSFSRSPHCDRGNKVVLLDITCFNSEEKWILGAPIESVDTYTNR